MKTKSRFIVILIVLILAALACNLPGGAKSGSSLPDGLTENYELPSGTVLSGSFNYSAAQEAVLQEHGNPTRFIILFGEAARQETWFYDAAGYSVVFRDGEKVSEKTEEAVYKEGMYATTYSSDLFYRGMSVDEIVLSTGRNKFMLTSVPDIEGMRLMDLEGLTIGLVDGKISYVETIPALTETLLTPDDFVRLTAEEAANQGAHPYRASYTVEGETFEDDFGMVEFSFQAGQVQVTFEGDVTTFQQTGTNKYFNEEDGGLTIIFTPEGFISWEVMEASLMTMTRTDGTQTEAGLPATSVSRTAEEMASAGTHFYTAQFDGDDASYVGDYGFIEIRFLYEEMLFSGIDATLLFDQIAPNQYYLDAGGEGATITFSANGLYYFLEGENAGVTLTRKDDAAQTTPEQPAQAASRTAEELANEGTHFYIFEETIDGEIYVEEFGTVEISFLEEEFLFTSDGETIIFNKIAPNQYYSDIEGGVSITFTADGFVWFFESDNLGIILIRQD